MRTVTRDLKSTRGCYHNLKQYFNGFLKYKCFYCVSPDSIPGVIESGAETRPEADLRSGAQSEVYGLGGPVDQGG